MLVKVNGTKEFMSIIENYKYENEMNLKLLKQGKTFEQGLKEMLNQRNQDIKKHEMEEDEAEKFQSHLGGISSFSNRLKMAMKSMEDDLKKQDRKNMITVLIKNKDDELDKEKVNEITEFGSEDPESALNKKLEKKNLLRKHSGHKNPLVPNTLFNFSRRNSKSKSEFEKEFDFNTTKNSQRSSKKLNNYIEIMPNIKNHHPKQLYNSSNLSQTTKTGNNYFTSSNAKSVGKIIFTFFKSKLKCIKKTILCLFRMTIMKNTE